MMSATHKSAQTSSLLPSKARGQPFAADQSFLPHRPRLVNLFQEQDPEMSNSRRNMPAAGTATRALINSQKKSIHYLAMKSFQGQLSMKVPFTDEDHRQLAAALESSLQRNPRGEVPNNMRLRRDQTNIRDIRNSSLLTPTTEHSAGSSSTELPTEQPANRPRQREYRNRPPRILNAPPSRQESVPIDAESLHRLCTSTANLLGLGVHQEEGRPSVFSDGGDSLHLDEATLHFLCREAAEMLGLEAPPETAEGTARVADSSELGRVPEFADKEELHERISLGGIEQTIEISPGVSLPFRGSEDTQLAILRGKTINFTCFGCNEDLTCVEEADWAICSECCTFSPLESIKEVSEEEKVEVSGNNNDNGDNEAANIVGLGIRAEMVQIVLLAETAGRCALNVAAP